MFSRLPVISNKWIGMGHINIHLWNAGQAREHLVGVYFTIQGHCIRQFYFWVQYVNWFCTSNRQTDRHTPIYKYPFVHLSICPFIPFNHTLHSIMMVYGDYYYWENRITVTSLYCALCNFCCCYCRWCWAQKKEVQRFKKSVQSELLTYAYMYVYLLHHSHAIDTNRARAGIIRFLLHWKTICNRDNHTNIYMHCAMQHNIHSFRCFSII